MNHSKRKLALLLLSLLPTKALAKTPSAKEIPHYSLQMTDVFLAHSLDNFAREKIVVAVIDTGADTSHPRLKENLWTNPGEVGLDKEGKDKSTNGVDDDKNGYVDDLHGWNFVSNSPYLTDQHGHGTHVAGIIQSVAPEANIMILKYFDPKASGEENLANTVKAIHYAIQMKARIINYSGGGSARFPEEEAAIKKAEQQRILFIAAAGNEKSNSDILGFYPADYELSNIVSVTAIDENNKVLPSSNYGIHSVDIAAPGKDIVSSLPGARIGTMTGTSQATAFVSGAAALLMSENPDLTEPEEIIRQLTVTGKQNAYLRGKTKFQTTLSTYRSLIMKGSSLGAFGTQVVDTYSAPDFSSKLDSDLETLESEELPFKIPETERNLSRHKNNWLNEVPIR